MLSLSRCASLSLSLFLHGAFTYFALPFFNRVGMSLQNVIILLCSQSFRLLLILSNQSNSSFIRSLFHPFLTLTLTLTLSLSFSFSRSRSLSFSFSRSHSLSFFPFHSLCLSSVSTKIRIKKTNKLCNDLNSVQRWWVIEIWDHITIKYAAPVGRIKKVAATVFIDIISE